MKTLKLLTATMLLLVTMAAGAETISDVTIGNLVYSLDTDTKVATVTGYDSSNESTDVVIPNTIEYGGGNYSVTTIGNKAFGGCSLASIYIPNSVTTIGEEAFFHCSSLASVNIPNSVTTIGEEAFWWCSSLASIYIPNSVTTIGAGAFAPCHSLASIGVASDNPNYIGIDGVLFNKDKTTIVAYPTGKDGSEYTIPNSVTTIGESAFSWCTSLASVNIPNSVTTIGKGAFKVCESLTSVNIPNTVTTIGNEAFSYCSSLASISVASDNPNYIGIDGVLFNKDKTTIVAYPAGKDGSEYTIPNSVTTIGESAFSSCSSLASINIPNSVTTIGELAFAECESLASITIGESVTTIGDGAFACCNAITSVICLAKECPVYESNEYDMFSVYETATLYVPKQSIDAYKTTYPWSEFVNVVALQDIGIEGKPMDNAPRVDAVYDIDGRRTDSMKRGLNIVRMSDGTTRKVMK